MITLYTEIHFYLSLLFHLNAPLTVTVTNIHTSATPYKTTTTGTVDIVSQVAVNVFLKLLADFPLLLIAILKRQHSRNLESDQRNAFKQRLVKIARRASTMHRGEDNHFLVNHCQTCQKMLQIYFQNMYVCIYIVVDLQRDRAYYPLQFALFKLYLFVLALQQI